MKDQTYSDAMARLESILLQLEEGSKSVDELSDLVKEAAELVKFCKTKLKTTEADIQAAFDGA
ncbi:exodeoxyribonuclease VII small subunit [Algoriphagus boritolerans]|uniref:Exodeoxyribonuclease VII small subunit n=1 Tax=Algoriphagus boritolerans DSM 17298 = JCM 18970 TaxID=1120964 RepID=A0A1H5WAH9_9BACT|nr:exodeoxyribonuclease VII small subunit [Algoriphagus boritolerans]SEF96474.1 Exodeoxyribonuclease VII small subunit [Algoriphagus boritolerans DSM 17298 = JCM 18970]